MLMSLAGMQVREQMRTAKSTLQHLLRHDPSEVGAEYFSESCVELDDRDQTCIICMDAPRSVAFLPCGHAVVCTGCSKLVMASGSLCPMCRERILHLSA